MKSIGLTITISIYIAAAKRDPTKKEIAEDMDHADWPVGPIGHSTEFHIVDPLLAMAYTKYPQACKALMAFIMDADQYNNWLYNVVRAYISHPRLRLMLPTRYGWKIRKRIAFRDFAETLAHDGRDWARSARRPQTPSSILCSSICSRATAPAARTPRARCGPPSGSCSGFIGELISPCGRSDDFSLPGFGGGWPRIARPGGVLIRRPGRVEAAPALPSPVKDGRGRSTRL